MRLGTPNKEEIEKMSHEERAHIKNLKVGRVGCGKIIFSEVDSNNFPLGKIIDNIVKTEICRATVYGDDTPIPKPSRGNGLNVPREFLAARQRRASPHIREAR